MVTIREINKDNYRECLSLQVGQTQQKFVASNLVSLAQAYIFHPMLLPYAIYSGDTMVGFVMMAINEKEKSYGIWRLMIDERYQNRGYGKKGLASAIEFFRLDGRFPVVYLSFVPGNDNAGHIYRSLGFVPTGEIAGEEVVMALKL